MGTFQVDIAEEIPPILQGDNSPVFADWVPVQGHVEVEVNGPQVILSAGKQDKSSVPSAKVSPLVDTKLADVQDLQVENPEEWHVEKQQKPDLQEQSVLDAEVLPEVAMETEAQLDPEFQMKDDQLDPEFQMKDDQLDPEFQMKEDQFDPEFQVEPEFQKKDVQLDPEVDKEVPVESEVQ